LTSTDLTKDHNESPAVKREQAKTSETSSASLGLVTSDAHPRLYVYCIVPHMAPKDFGRIGVEGNGSVYTIEYRDIAAVVSEFPGDKFEKEDANTLAHQRVVRKVFEKVMGIPIQFGTLAKDKKDVTRLLEQGYEKYKEQIAKLVPADDSAIDESPEPADIIAEILAQSAASAVRIRQLTNDLDSIKRREYEKGAGRMVEGAAKRLLEFLAKAPAGTVQVSDSPSAVSEERIQQIQQRLDVLADEISFLVKKTSEQSDDRIESIKRNQERIEEEIRKIAATSEKSLLVVEKTVLGTLRDYFDHVSPAMEVFVSKAVGDTLDAQSSRIQPPPRLSSQSLAPAYTICAWCGSEIPKISKFCYRCGEPNSYQLDKMSLRGF
jgi:ElaB/YqjD/DUF883 family membrane-anchored ribosome-binding protein